MDWLTEAVVISPEVLGRWVQAALLVLFGVVLSRVLGSLTERMIGRISKPERATLDSRRRRRRTLDPACLAIGQLDP